MSKHLSISNNIGQYLWSKIYQKNAEINQYTHLRHGGPSHAKQTIIENQACIGVFRDAFLRNGNERMIPAKPVNQYKTQLSVRKNNMWEGKL